MAATVQAQRVARALRGIGLKQGRWQNGGDFRVATDVRRIRHRGTGRRYSEFGDASAHLNTRTACAIVEGHAKQLAADGHHVILCYADDGELVTAVVSSKYNPRRVVSIFDRDGWREEPSA